MKKYVVICCVERSMNKVGQANSIEVATQILRQDFIEYMSDFDDFDLYEEEAEGYCLGETWAWSNLDDDQNVDWVIIEVN